MDLHPDIERLALLGWRLHPVSRRTRAACFAHAATLATSDLDQLPAGLVGTPTAAGASCFALAAAGIAPGVRSDVP